jgi:hypothetical protein
MSDYTIKGGASCVWGVDETLADAGTITDVQYDDVSVSENCENQEGAVDGVVVYDGNQTVKLTIVAKASATVPAKDSTLTIDTVAFLVQRVGKAKRHKGKMIFTVDAIHHDNMTLT